MEASNEVTICHFNCITSSGNVLLIEGVFCETKWLRGRGGPVLQAVTDCAATGTLILENLYANPLLSSRSLISQLSQRLPLTEREQKAWLLLKIQTHAVVSILGATFTHSTSKMRLLLNLLGIVLSSTNYGSYNWQYVFQSCVQEQIPAPVCPGWKYLCSMTSGTCLTSLCFSFLTLKGQKGGLLYWVALRFTCHDVALRGHS